MKPWYWEVLSGGKTLTSFVLIFAQFIFIWNPFSLFFCFYSGCEIVQKTMQQHFQRSNLVETFDSVFMVISDYLFVGSLVVRELF